MSRLPRRAGRALWQVTVVLAAGLCALVSTLPDPSRPVVVAAAASLVAAIAAAASGWRPAGDAAVALATVAVLLAATLDRSDLRAVQVVLAGPLVLLMVTALDGAASAPPGEVTVIRSPTASRLAPAAAGTGAAVLVAVTAAQQVVPSVPLALLGLAAAVAAMAVATRGHRN